MLRADHPRSTYVLTDRPDRWLEVGVDRQTGFIVRLVEHIGDVVTRHAEVTSLELDPAIPDEAFTGPPARGCPAHLLSRSLEVARSMGWTFLRTCN